MAGSPKRDINDMVSRRRSTITAHQQGAHVCYAGPHVDARGVVARWIRPSRWLDQATLAGIDCVAILTEHSAFDYDAIAAAAPLVVDTRNAIKQTHPHVFKLGAPQPAHAATYQPAGASDQAA